MIVAIDTSSFVAFLQGGSGLDVEAVDRALDAGTAMFPPVVLTELLSDPKLPQSFRQLLKRVPCLDIQTGYWERAGECRAEVFSKKSGGKRLKARLGDALIAQCCIDNRVPLITRDKDFRHFAKYTDLKLL